MAYEYLIVTTAASADAKSKDQTQDALNAAGGQGWRLVNSFPSQNGTWIVMEKQLQATGGHAR